MKRRNKRLPAIVGIVCILSCGNLLVASAEIETPHEEQQLPAKRARFTISMPNPGGVTTSTTYRTEFIRNGLGGLLFIGVGLVQLKEHFVPSFPAPKADVCATCLPKINECPQRCPFLVRDATVGWQKKLAKMGLECSYPLAFIGSIALGLNMLRNVWVVESNTISVVRGGKLGVHDHETDAQAPTELEQMESEMATKNPNKKLAAVGEPLKSNMVS